MSLLNLYLLLSSVVFLFLGTVWTRESWSNVTLKIVFWVLFFGGALLGLSASGIVLSSGVRLI